MSISLVRFIPAAVFIILGIAVMVIETIGIFRIRYSLNKMHASAMGDSLGILLISIGIIIIYGFSFVSLKVICIVLLFWIASPTCSHLLANFEAFTNDNIEDECEVPKK